MVGGGAGTCVEDGGGALVAGGGAGAWVEGGAEVDGEEAQPARIRLIAIARIKTNIGTLFISFLLIFWLYSFQNPRKPGRSLNHAFHLLNRRRLQYITGGIKKEFSLIQCSYACSVIINSLHRHVNNSLTLQSDSLKRL